MKIVEILRMVSINIRQNLFKVLLTSLGIIVGTVTIVMVLAIGKGGEDEVASQFTGLSAETIYINPDYTREFDSAKMSKLSLELVEHIKFESQALEDMYLRATTYQEVTIKSEKEYLAIAGVGVNYELISNYTLAYGEQLSEVDLENETKVAVIGHQLATQYFTTPESAIGEYLKLGNHQVKIVGVLDRKEEGLHGVNPDDTIFVPYTTANRYLFDDAVIPQAVGLVKDLSLVPRAIKEIASTLNYYLDDGRLYIIEDTGSRIEAAMQSAKTMNLLLISMATIVFIVGGIGIMNILFVSVKDRTKEIGILKALGSSKKDIMMQFLIESIAIGLFGGLMGVGLSYVCLPLLSYFELTISFSHDFSIIALGFAVATSGLFGFYPAYKAAQLQPIQALNQE